MDHVYVLFEMVHAPVVFVVCDGGLKGMISRQNLSDSLKSDKLKAVISLVRGEINL
jgi:hypothetical protein